jgi:hypothetical protein
MTPAENTYTLGFFLSFFLSIPRLFEEKTMNYHHPALFVYQLMKPSQIGLMDA